MMAVPDFKICPYCGNRASFIFADSVPWTGNAYPGATVWACVPCEAHVKADVDGAPIGRLANAELRRAKILANEALNATICRLREAGRSIKVARQTAHLMKKSALGGDFPIAHCDVEQCEKIQVALSSGRGA